MRKFADDRGRWWEVWEVLPERSDRRRGSERRRVARGHERRTRDDPTVLEALARAAGWLVFESGRERRRLMPIPSGWETLATAALAALLPLAAFVPAPRRLLG